MGLDTDASRYNGLTFFPSYTKFTKLAKMLMWTKANCIQQKKLPSLQIDLETLGHWELFVLHSYAFQTELTWRYL